MATGSGTLSLEQEEKILQFQEITGNDDFQKALHILTAFQWDLAAAVQDTLNERESIQPNIGQQQQGQPQLRRRGQGPPNFLPPAFPPPIPFVTRVVARRPPMGWLDWTISMVTLPFRFMYSFGYDLFNFLLAIVLGARPPPVSPDPTGDVRHFAARFTSTFGEQGPPLPQVGYSRIAEQAKEEVRFLLVYLHNWELPESEEYCRNVICSEEFVQVIRERNLLFWAVDVQSAEGKRVQYIVNGGNYPYVAVAMLKESRMTLIGRFEGSISKNAFMSALNSILDRSEPELVVTRHEKQERQVAQILRQQQEDAYLQSLKADKEKEEKRKAEMEQELRKETYAQEKNKEWETECEYRISQLPQEPDPTSENLIHVVVRSTAGERLERNFLTTDKLHVLYDFALKCKDIPRCYVLATNYPKKILKLDDTGGPLLADLDLGKKCIVFVQDTTEDDEDE